MLFVILTAESGGREEGRRKNKTSASHGSVRPGTK